MRVIYQPEIILWDEIDIFSLLRKNIPDYNLTDSFITSDKTVSISTLDLQALTCKNYNYRVSFKPEFVIVPQVLIYIYWHIGIPIKIVIWSNAAFSQQDIDERCYVHEAKESVINNSALYKITGLETEYAQDFTPQDKIPTPMRYRPADADKVSMVMLSVHGEEQAPLIKSFFDRLTEGLDIAHDATLYLTNNSYQRKFSFSFNANSIMNEEKQECKKDFCRTCSFISLKKPVDRGNSINGLF